MTTVAWDGTTLAADGQANHQGNRVQTVKAWKEIFLLKDRHKHVAGTAALIAVTGNYSWGLAMKRWFMAGAHPDKFERPPDEASFARLVVIDDEGCRVRAYESLPDPIQLLDPFCAWGSGMDFAIAAMHLGLPARQAVDVAHKFDPSTGPCVLQLTF